MISDQTKQRWQEIIERSVENSHRITDWETEFIDSISIQISKKNELTHRQTKVIYSIAHKYGF